MRTVDFFQMIVILRASDEDARRISTEVLGMTLAVPSSCALHFHCLLYFP